MGKKDRKKQADLKRKQKINQKKMMKKNHSRGNAFKLCDQYIKYYEEFEKQISFLQVKLKDVEGDGNCLFRAIADQFDGSQQTHLYLRQQACKYILDNHEFFKNFIDQDQDGSIQQYTNMMKKNGEYGGHLELQALSECLQSVFVIHKKQLQEYYVKPIMTEIKGPIFHLAYFQTQNFEHYLSIRCINDNSNDPGYLRLKTLNNQKYGHLINVQDPEQFALRKQIEQISLKNDSYQSHEKQIEQPYPGLPYHKKCKCLSGNLYKNCCLKKYSQKRITKDSS